MTTPTTTSYAIRDQWITLIEAVTPKRLTGTPFRVYTGRDDFRTWAAAGGKSRSFHVKLTGDQDGEGAHQVDLEPFILGEAVMTIAYRHDWTEWKRQAARREYLDLEAQAIQDGNQIRDTIGLPGGANYLAGQSRCDCNLQRDLEDEEGVSFLVLNLSYRFNRSVG